MKRPLKFAPFCLLAVGLLPGSVSAQSVPAAASSVPHVGFQIPRLGGSFNYALSASELISTGFYNEGTAASTNFSGDLGYISSSPSHPFSAIYSGGLLVANSGQPTTTYQNLSLSQIYSTKHWNFEVQDSASYLPESPATGLSGIPGVGDLGVDPVPVGPASGIGILTTYGPRVSNTVTGSVSRSLSPHISAQASGYYSAQYFVGDNSSEGVDNHGEGGSIGLTYRFDARDNLTGNYNYSSFGYPGSNASYSAQGGTIEFSRQWSRRLTTDAYAGPQYLTSSGFGSLPSSTQLTAGAGASYNARTIFYTINYSRGAQNGSGVIPGAFSDNITGAVHRQFGRAWNVSGSLGWSKNSSLPVFETYNFSSNSLVAGGQVSRGFGRRWSGYGSYTLEHQSTAGNVSPLNAFHGFYQVFAFGVSYSGGSIPLGK